MKRVERERLQLQLKEEVEKYHLSASEAAKKYDELFGTHYYERLCPFGSKCH